MIWGDFPSPFCLKPPRASTSHGGSAQGTGARLGKSGGGRANAGGILEAQEIKWWFRKGVTNRIFEAQEIMVESA